MSFRLNRLNIKGLWEIILQFMHALKAYKKVLKCMHIFLLCIGDRTVCVTGHHNLAFCNFSNCFMFQKSYIN